MDLIDLDRKVLEVIKEDPMVGVTGGGNDAVDEMIELNDALKGSSKESVTARLEMLEAVGYVIRHGKGRRRWNEVAITEAGLTALAAPSANGSAAPASQTGASSSSGETSTTRTQVQVILDGLEQMQQLASDLSRQVRELDEIGQAQLAEAQAERDAAVEAHQRIVDRLSEVSTLATTAVTEATAA